MNAIFGYIFKAMIPFLIYGICTGHSWHIVTLIIVTILAVIFHASSKHVKA